MSKWIPTLDFAVKVVVAVVALRWAEKMVTAIRVVTSPGASA